MSHRSNERRTDCVARGVDSGTRRARIVDNPLHKGEAKMQVTSEWVARAQWVMRMVALVAVVFAAVGLPVGSYWE